MKIVFVSRSNSGQPHPFIKEQAEVLSRNFNIEVKHFLITKGGIQGYSKAVFQLFKFIRFNKVDIIHVHYGLWSFVAILTKVLFFKNYKIVITFHGSDIHKNSERRVSLLGSYFASHNIIVSERMLRYIRRNYSLIPCGINTDIQLNQRDNTRLKYGWTENDFIILFSSGFDRKEKDPEFAFRIIDDFSKSTTKSVRFIELKGYNRIELTQLMQAADALIMCSISEGSPQVVKEAILNSLPVISNDVGDVKLICSGVDNCFIISKKVDEYVKCLINLSNKPQRVQNRTPVLERFDNDLISKKLFNIYCTVLG